MIEFFGCSMEIDIQWISVEGEAGKDELQSSICFVWVLCHSEGCDWDVVRSQGYCR